MMDTLTIDKALELHLMLGKHIPEIDENEDALQFIGKIVKNIRESDQHKDYVDAVMLMSGKDWDEVKQMESDIVLELFVGGLSKNRIIQLKDFCNKVGFSDVS